MKDAHIRWYPEYVNPTKKRSDLKPGQIFVRAEPWLDSWEERGPFVVLDDKYETHFYRGGEWWHGDVVPSIEVEVIS